MRFVVAILLVCLFVGTTVSAQENVCTDTNEIVRFGVGAFYGLDFHTAKFKGVEPTYTCCPQFESGSGTTIGAALSVEKTLTPSFRIATTLSVRSQNGEIVKDEIHSIGVGPIDKGTFRFTVDSRYTSVGLSLLGVYKTTLPLAVFGGVDAAMIVGSSFTQQERIIDPPGVQYLFEQSTTRLKVSGDIPTTQGRVIPSAIVGARWELPVSTNNAWKLTPSVWFQEPFATVMPNNGTWKVRTLGVGLSLSYSLFSVPTTEPVIVPDTIPEIKNVIAQKKAIETPPLEKVEIKPPPKLKAALSVQLTDGDGKNIDGDALTVDELVQVTTLPLLNYIFFDSTSSSFQERYVQLQSSATHSFNFDMLNNLGTMRAYGHLLNIVGKRMREDTLAKINITGCNGDVGAEKSNKELSQQRAKTVADYLTNVWGISPTRLQIQARNLPEKPSRTTVADGAEENRRVELTSTSKDILKPIITLDTILVAQSAKSIVVTPYITSSENIDEWSIQIVQSGKVLREFSGKGEVPSTVALALDENRRAISLTKDPIDISLQAKDVAGKSISTSYLLPVNTQSRSDIRRELFNLILFDFGQSAITGINKATVDFIKTRIDPSMNVFVEGMTDRVGEVAVNQALSAKRAKAVAQILKVPDENVRGTGNTDIYDNNLPEGRFYSRTVKILIEAKKK